MTHDEYKLMLTFLNVSENHGIDILVYINKTLLKTKRRFGLAGVMEECAGNGKQYCLDSLGSRGECYVILDFDETYTFDYEDIKLCKMEKVESKTETVFFNYDLNSTEKIFNE